ncbi:tetratricopeptide repeat protein [Aliikangiella coralliicola]|uniref:tetratricopeptide repeat protein n=1 Tax=Aliikangiella coralliicola TaxID=2592383 RepID=UPI00143CFFEF|nr:tetratricopeptide repeat protein [Aliikangiella coralliicola]
MKYFTLLFILIFSTLTEARDKPERVKNYEAQLATAEGIERISPLAELAKYYAYENPESSIRYASEALELITAHKDFSRAMFTHHYLVLAYYNAGKFDLMEKQLEIYAEVAKSVAEKDELAMLNKDYAYLYSRRDSNYTKAIPYLIKALELYRQMPPETDNINAAIGGTLNDIGLMNYYNDNFDKALEYYTKALNTVGYQNTVYVVRTLGNIALIHRQYQRYDEALDYYFRALALARKHKSYNRIAEQLINITATHVQKKDYVSALTSIKEAKELNQSIGDMRNKFQISRYTGEIYKGQKDYESAVEHLNSALKIATEMKTPRFVAESEMALGNVYIEKENYQSAIVHFQKALNIGKELEFESLTMNAHLDLSKAFRAVGNTDKAYENLKDHYRLKEIRLDEGRVKKLAELEEQFKAEQRESEIQILTKENELKSLQIERQTYQRNMWIAGLVLLAFVSFFLFYRQSQKRKITAERAEMMAELVEKKNQLLADVSHELRTPLTVLQLKVEALQHNLVEDVNASYDGLMTKIGDINHMISDIYQLAQSDIGALKLDLKENNCKQTFGSWMEEFSSVVKAKDFKWQQELNIAEEVCAIFDEARIKQVINNLINNSLAYTDAPGKILFTANIADKWLVIKLEDSSPGVPPALHQKIFERLFRVESSRSRSTGGSGLGLSICKSIVDAHQGKIFAADSPQGGLSITIQLPVSKGRAH